MVNECCGKEKRLKFRKGDGSGMDAIILHGHDLYFLIPRAIFMSGRRRRAADLDCMLFMEILVCQPPPSV